MPKPYRNHHIHPNPWSTTSPVSPGRVAFDRRIRSNLTLTWNTSIFQKGLLNQYSPVPRACSSIVGKDATGYAQIYAGLGTKGPTRRGSKMAILALQEHEYSLCPKKAICCLSGARSVLWGPLCPFWIPSLFQKNQMEKIWIVIPCYGMSPI